MWWMTLKNNTAPLLCYIKLCASFQSNSWMQTGVIVHKRPIRVKIGDLLSHVTLKFDGWPWKNNRALLLCYAKLRASFRSHKRIQTGDTVWKILNSGKNRRFYVARDLEIWRMTWKWNAAPHSPETPNSGQNRRFFPTWHWNLMDDLEKQYGTSFMILQALCIIS